MSLTKADIQEIRRTVAMNNLTQTYMEMSGFFDADYEGCAHCGHTEWDGKCVWCEPSDADDDSPNFPDDDSLNPGGYDLGRLT